MDRNTGCPRQESNLVFDLRKVACGYPSHSEDIGRWAVGSGRFAVAGGRFLMPGLGDGCQGPSRSPGPGGKVTTSPVLGDPGICRLECGIGNPESWSGVRVRAFANW